MTESDSSAQAGQGQLTEEDIRNMSPEQLKELQKKNCIFCHIIAGRVASKKIYEDDRVLAILDINPANPGHLLLMPKEHFTIMPQMPDGELGYMSMVSKALSRACLSALKAEGTNIFVANGIAAGQKSPHFMIHIVPRKSNDGVSNFGLLRRKLERKTLVPVQQAIVKRTLETMPGNLAVAVEDGGGEENSAEMETAEKSVEVHNKENHQDTSKGDGAERAIVKPEGVNAEQSQPINAAGASQNNRKPASRSQISSTSQNHDEDEKINIDDIARVLLGKK